MSERIEELALAVGSVAGPVARPNRGWFAPGDRRINRQGRPRGSKSAAAGGIDPADCAPQADRLKRLLLPATEMVWHLGRPQGFWLSNLPADVEIVAARVDAGQVVFVLRSSTFPPVARGALIPALVPAFNGLRWRRDNSWRPQS